MKDELLYAEVRDLKYRLLALEKLVDSLAVNDDKPRGLSRGENGSLAVHDHGE